MNPKKRPAESITGAAGFAIVIAYVSGVDDPQVILGMAAMLAALPAIITGIVEVYRGQTRS